MHKSKTQSRNPSFSSTLLDDIYNSIDVKTQKSQSFVSSVYTNRKQSISADSASSLPDRKILHDRFFGSISSSSDSNSSIFSSSDTEITHAKKITSSRPLCFGPSKTKPRKTEDKALFHQNRNIRVYDYTSDASKFSRYDENWENPRARRSSRSSGDVKKPKTPASPAGRIVNFINSLFNNNSKQSTAVTSYPRKKSLDDSKPNDYHRTTCSSASSFSRSCLNKNSDKSSDRIKRSVRFSPINVIAHESFTSRSFFRKPEEEEEEDYLSNGNIRKSVEDGGRRSVEEIAREFLRDYHKNHENSLVKSNGFEDYEDEDDDDDDASDLSSDLFELDLVGNHHNVYGDELPVYETTFAGFIM